jgi:centromeric protein E
VFLVRAFFVEMHNEEVRGLLRATSILEVREDPQRGAFVNSEEIIATDFSSLPEILFSGEKNRAVAATGMNERSSRSHTIFCITIESRLKSDEHDPNAANTASEEDGALRVSTLTLVDLAGSESVRQTGNTGDRLKEGAKINQRYVI